MGRSNPGAKGDSATTNDGDDLPASNSATYSDGEKVLAYHGPRIYEARVEKTEFSKTKWRYFVHYLGWNKSWNEWVGTDRLMKHTEDNIMKQQALEKKQVTDKSSKSGHSNQAKPKTSTDAKVEKEVLKNYVSKGKKWKNDSVVEDNVSTGKLVKIQIPSALKKQLIEDFEFVNQQDKLVKLPRFPSVDDILTKYHEYRSKKDSVMADSVGEILKGLRCYFDKALPALLLYKQERQQYQDFVVDNISPSAVYGAEHLLRLFVKLPELLAYVNIEEDTLVHLQQKLLDFLKYLHKNQNTFFLSVYDGSKGREGISKGKDD
ncbi:MRG domain [Dillenia turbinata]|uniref:MRG domain n=1 Tax=Dillenia turbinata TaxID=194707 RepID=A0AAN8V5M7_9MAGN